MSTLSFRRVRLALGAALGRAGFFVLAAVLALGGAGLAAQLWHPPGGLSRAELTYQADQALGARLDATQVQLGTIATDVDQLAAAAKSALAALGSTDAASLRSSLDGGAAAANRIQTESKTLRDSLAGLPGDGPDAALTYANATLVRRAAILAALDATGGLAAEWANISGRSLQAANLTSLLEQHETTVAAAADSGRQRQYREAITTLAQATSLLDQIQQLREQLIAGGEPTVLDEWITRHRTYDLALLKLYRALDGSGGHLTIDVKEAFKEEEAARQLLPTNNTSIVVIVSEVARGGLNEAAVAVDDARGRLDTALGQASPG